MPNADLDAHFINWISFFFSGLTTWGWRPFVAQHSAHSALAFRHLWMLHTFWENQTWHVRVHLWICPLYLFSLFRMRGQVALVKSAARTSAGQEHGVTHRQVSIHTRISIHRNRHTVSSIKIGLSQLHFHLHTKWYGHTSLGSVMVISGETKTSSSLRLNEILRLTKTVERHILKK